MRSTIPILWASLLAASGLLACTAPRQVPAGGRAELTASAMPPICRAHPAPAGWAELQSAVAPLAFRVPPGVRRVSESREIVSAAATRLSFLPDRTEEWERAGGAWVVSVAHFTGLATQPGWSGGSVDRTECALAIGAAGGSPAVLRTYRMPGAEVRGAGSTAEHHMDLFEADLLVPLEPRVWVVVSARAQDSTELVVWARALESARRTDR